jgi:hypothetical protein
MHIDELVEENMEIEVIGELVLDDQIMEVGEIVMESLLTDDLVMVEVLINHVLIGMEVIFDEQVEEVGMVEVIHGIGIEEVEHDMFTH